MKIEALTDAITKISGEAEAEIIKAQDWLAGRAPMRSEDAQKALNMARAKLGAMEIVISTFKSQGI